MPQLVADTQGNDVVPRDLDNSWQLWIWEAFWRLWSTESQGDRGVPVMSPHPTHTHTHSRRHPTAHSFGKLGDEPGQVAELLGGHHAAGH